MLGQPTSNFTEKPVTVGKKHSLMSPPQHQGVLTQTVCGFFLFCVRDFHHPGNLLADYCTQSQHCDIHIRIKRWCQGKNGKIVKNYLN